MKRILVLTGRLAAPIVRSAAEDASRLFGISIDVDVLAVPVAALMTVRDVLEHLSRDPGRARSYDLILAPGLLIGDLSIVNKALGVRCYKGSRYAGDLSRVVEALVGGAELSTSRPADSVLNLRGSGDVEKILRDLERASAEAFSIGGLRIPLEPPPFRIFAEVNVEEPLEGVVKRAARAASQGADLIVLGTHADSDSPELVARAFREVRRRVEKPLGVDSISPREVEAGVSEGAVLVMNISRSFFHLVEKLGRDLAYVLVPEEVEDGTAEARARALERDLEALVKGLRASKVILDPVIPPPHFGALEALYAVGLVRRRLKGFPALMSSANVVEMIDTDSVGINALLVSLSLEAGASAILVTEDSWKTRGSVAEVRRASTMCSLAHVRKSPPKDLGIDLFLAKSKKGPERVPIPFSEDVRVDRYVPPSRLDRERFFTIQVDPEEGLLEVYVFTGDRERASYRVRGRDPRSVGRVALKLSGIQDPEHALYLGIELARAHKALVLGGGYEQDVIEEG